MTLRERLIGLHACPDGLAWLGRRGIDRAWRECRRADWMLWAAARLGVDRKKIVLSSCACARTSLHLFEKKYPADRRPRVAIETAEAWCRGEATIEQVRAAYDAASAAYDDAYAAYDAATAAYAAASAAASAAYDAYDAATYAAYAAAYDDDDDAYDADGRIKAIARMAIIVREHITVADLRRAMAGAEREVGR